MILSLLFFIVVLCVFLGIEFFYKASFKIHRFLIASLNLLGPFILILIWNFFANTKHSASIVYAGLILSTCALALQVKILIKEYQSFKGEK